MRANTNDQKRHVAPSALKYLKFHGPLKSDLSELLDSDIVLTTYATLTADSSQKNLLRNIHWYRIILDEGT